MCINTFENVFCFLCNYKIGNIVIMLFVYLFCSYSRKGKQNCYIFKNNNNVRNFLICVKNQNIFWQNHTCSKFKWTYAVQVACTGINICALVILKRRYYDHTLYIWELLMCFISIAIIEKSFNHTFEDESN